jgi:hypothetical protein
VDVVGHPAPAQQIGLAWAEMESQQMLVAAPVLFGQEDVLAIVAAVGDVMRCTDRDRAGRAAGDWGRPADRAGSSGRACCWLGSRSPGLGAGFGPTVLRQMAPGSGWDWLGGKVWQDSARFGVVWQEMAWFRLGDFLPDPVLPGFGQPGGRLG